MSRSGSASSCGKALLRREREVDPLRGRGGSRGLDRAGGEPAEVDALPLEREAAGVDARDEEDVVHEPVQTEAVAVHDLEEVRLLLAELARLAVHEQLEVADHRRERRAELVRDGAHELVLHAVELDQLRVPLGERLRRIALGLQQALSLDRKRELRRHGRERIARTTHEDSVAVHHEHPQFRPLHLDRRGERVSRVGLLPWCRRARPCRLRRARPQCASRPHVAPARRACGEALPRSFCSSASRRVRATDPRHHVREAKHHEPGNGHHRGDVGPQVERLVAQALDGQDTRRDKAGDRQERVPHRVGRGVGLRALLGERSHRSRQAGEPDAHEAGEKRRTPDPAGVPEAECLGRIERSPTTVNPRPATRSHSEGTRQLVPITKRAANETSNTSPSGYATLTSFSSAGQRGVVQDRVDEIHPCEQQREQRDDQSVDQGAGLARTILPLRRCAA